MADWLTPAVPSPGYIESPQSHNPLRGVLLESPKGPNHDGCCPKPPTIPFGRPVHFKKLLGVASSLCIQSKESRSKKFSSL